MPGHSARQREQVRFEIKSVKVQQPHTTHTGDNMGILRGVKGRWESAHHAKSIEVKYKARLPARNEWTGRHVET